MSIQDLLRNRRGFLRGMTMGAVWCVTPGAFADELTRTPRQTEGPFYPDKLPLDTDNDLLIINDGITPGLGEITWLSGRILNAQGAPMRNAVVEIWQCDNNGAYLHSKTGNKEKQDGNFQGFGRFVTGSTGEYLFRTIKPVPYPGRTPHIHYAVKMKGREKFTTQCYIDGHPGNARDSVLSQIKNPREKAALMSSFLPMKDSRIGELTARFDIVLG
ncbi:MAG: intradiol ring-cleavage dioxygenase [Blastocatellia bacterium]